MIASSTGLGFHFFRVQKERVEICDELCALCDGLLIDLGYSVTPIKILVNNLCSQYMHISFINEDFIENKSFVATRLNNTENEEISRFLYSLGKSDLQSQKNIVAGFKEYITQSKNKYKKEHDKNGKMYICFCSFSGIILSLVLF